MPFSNTVCPACQGTDLAPGSPLVVQQGDHAGGILTPTECENCGATWIAVYRPTGFIKLVAPGQGQASIR